MGGKNMNFKDALKEAKDKCPERKFKQTVEVIFNLTGLDTKNFSLNDAITLPAGRGKPLAVCAVGNSDFVMLGKKTADKTIDKNEFEKYKTKKDVRKLSDEIDYFVVEAPVMAEFAKVFGQILGPKGKMPLPHHIIPPAGDPTGLISVLKKTVRIKAKKTAVVQIPIGTEEMSFEDLDKNYKAVYDYISHKLEQGKDNIKNIIVKLSMGPVVKIDG